MVTDTPLGVTTTAHVFVPGEPVTGDVIYPDGRMTVTISAQSVPHVDGKHSVGATRCAYRSSKQTFSCPTNDLPHGLYLVQVTDGAQPGEGTALAQVAIAPFRAYDPTIRRVDEAADAHAGEPVRLRLSGWRPRVPVTVSLVYDYTTKLDSAVLVPRSDGTVEWTTKRLRAGYYTIDADDGLWKIGGVYGERSGAYYGFHTAGAK